jgi:HEAT repeat protein
LLDDAGQPRSAAGKPSQGAVIVTLMAHAERPVPKGEPDIAERTLDVSLPLSEERAAELKAFLTARLQEASAVATADVLGELWARGLDEAAVLALLDDDVLWRRVAGAREAGERGLKAARERLEKAARDSRKDLAVVAAAALGRLGDPRSVPVLIECLGATRAEVVDAVLGALTDIGSAPALAAIQRMATEHGNPEIRQRAAALLQGRAGRHSGRQAEQAPAPTP